jgi:hypothetical protein
MINDLECLDNGVGGIAKQLCVSYPSFLHSKHLFDLGTYFGLLCGCDFLSKSLIENTTPIQFHDHVLE